MSRKLEEIQSAKGIRDGGEAALIEQIKGGLRELEGQGPILMEGHFFSSYDPDTNERKIVYHDGDESRSIPNTGVHEMTVWAVQTNGVWVKYEDEEGAQVRFLNPSSIRIHLPPATSDA